MSDALTDIATDQRKASLFAEALIRLVDYLKKPSINNLAAVLAYAEQIDSMRGGYWSGKTSLSTGILSEKSIEKLRNGDKELWAKLLRFSFGYNVYDKLKALSPFHNKILVVVDYGWRGARPTTIEGEAVGALSKVIEDNGLPINDCQKYMLAFPQLNSSDIEVLTLTPRKIKSC